MAKIQMQKKELIDFILIYCNAPHIGKENKVKMLEQTLNQFYDKIEELEKELQPLKARIQMLLEL